MEHDLQDTLQNLTMQRRQRSQSLQEKHKNQEACKSLSRYSKRLFDDVILSANTSDTGSKSARTPGTSSSGSVSTLPNLGMPKKVPAYAHSGPTIEGSPFHNLNTHLRNSVMAKASSVTQSAPCRFNHERTRAVPKDIHQTLQRSNSNYKVSSPSVSPTYLRTTSVLSYAPSMLSFSDFQLVPMSESPLSSWAAPDKPSLPALAEAWQEVPAEPAPQKGHLDPEEHGHNEGNDDVEDKGEDTTAEEHITDSRPLLIRIPTIELSSSDSGSQELSSSALEDSDGQVDLLGIEARGRTQYKSRPLSARLVTLPQR